MGLELNDYGMQQRRIAHMRFLGELYNYELVDSSVIFDTLYLILVFGHGTSEVWMSFQPIFSCIHIVYYLFWNTVLSAWLFQENVALLDLFSLEYISSATARPALELNLILKNT